MRYLILSNLILSREISKSSLNIISLKRYRDEILIEYLVRRYIYEIVLNILATNKIRIILSRRDIFFFSFLSILITRIITRNIYIIFLFKIILFKLINIYKRIR